MAPTSILLGSSIPLRRSSGELHVEQAAGGLELGDLGHHREHDLQVPAGRRQHQRAQLAAQDGRPVEHHTQRPPAHGRIVLGRHAPVGQMLVAADIEGAERHRPAAGSVQRVAIVRRLGVRRRGSGCGS